MKKNIPIWVQTFEEIIKKNRVYVDKTHIFLELLRWEVKYNFLSRPRRFGKSLIVSTFKALFQGKKELFKDLHIYDKRDFANNTCPVVHISWWAGFFENKDYLQVVLHEMIDWISREENIKLENKTTRWKFQELIQKLYQKIWNQVVVLIDE